MTDYQERIAHLQSLKHRPYRSPRNFDLGEQAFAEMWQQLMLKEYDSSEEEDDVEGLNSYFVDIIFCLRGSFEEVFSQRNATLLASVVTWLGTNCGRSFLHEAEKYKPQFGTLSYVVRWSIDNLRLYGLDYNLTILEHVMCDLDTIFRIQQQRYVRESDNIPVFSGMDIEAVNASMLWLGHSNGQQFLKDAQQKIDAIREQKRVETFKAWKEQSKLK